MLGSGKDCDEQGLMVRNQASSDDVQLEGLLAQQPNVFIRLYLTPGVGAVVPPPMSEGVAAVCGRAYAMASHSCKSKLLLSGSS